MSAEDVKITAAARRVLTSQWIDITRARVRTTRGTIYLQGHLARMTHEYGDLTENNLQQINLQLRRIPGVRSVSYQLTNWQRDGLGAWRKRAAGERTEIDRAADEPPAAAPPA